MRPPIGPRGHRAERRDEPGPRAAEDADLTGPGVSGAAAVVAEEGGGGGGGDPAGPGGGQEDQGEPPPPGVLEREQDQEADAGAEGVCDHLGV